MRRLSRVAQSVGYSKMDVQDGQQDMHNEHLYLLRSLLFGALTMTGLLYGLAVYYGLSSAQTAAAGLEFKSVAAQAGHDIRKSFAKSSVTLNYLAERYATTFPDEADWPTVLLPGFGKDMHYLRDISGFESLAFMPLIKPADVNRTERFLLDAWAADPLIPAAAGVFGIYGVNASDNLAVYKDTTKVDWDAQYTVVLPVAQMEGLTLPTFLGTDMHSLKELGLPMEDVMRCTLASNYTYARESCGRITKLDHTDQAQLFTAPTVTSNIIVPILLKENRYTTYYTPTPIKPYSSMSYITNTY
jgi:hypothetical protein